MPVHVVDGSHADAWRLGNVDAVDADAGTDMDRTFSIIRWHVGRDDGGDVLPSLLPMLRGFRQAVRGTSDMRADQLTAIVGAGYFLVWTLFGMVVFSLGVMLATCEMQHPALARAVPATTDAIVILAGALQFTPWKAHHLAGCREAAGGHEREPHSGSAFRHGLDLGLHCNYCCVGLTAILVAGGVMNLRLMILIAGAITAERLAPDDQRVARVLGAVIMVAGVFLIVRAAVLG